ncbi:hypothetical protein ACFPM0_26925 [Pseudonocardia sulfidoxydans]|uniref:hypothetical protein n=1 Tax=Pseudonocardia sulfidoxydans TaxID=54011 RepID=UPI0036234F54
MVDPVVRHRTGLGTCGVIRGVRVREVGPAPGPSSPAPEHVRSGSPRGRSGPDGGTFGPRAHRSLLSVEAFTRAGDDAPGDRHRGRPPETGEACTRRSRSSSPSSGHRADMSCGPPGS